MPGTEPFDYLSLWGIFAATMALALLAVVAGYFLGSRLRTEEAKKAPVGELVGAMLTLASLLLAFTFGWAQSHFDTRRDLLLDEANAIGTTWLRARLVPEPHRSEVRKLLHEYLEVRLQAAQSGKLQQLPELQQAIGRSEHLHDRLWAEAGRIGEIDPQSEMAALFVASLNQVIDLHAKRVQFGLRTRIAGNIWGALYLITLLSLGLMGYHAGLGGARPFFSMFLAVVTFSIVLLLIADLDRPYEGLLKTNQQALIDLRRLMDTNGT
jgi:hypothetical protein